MIRAFVTGGSGFLGQRLLRTLVSKGVKVRALARSDSAAGTVERAGAEAARGELNDVEALARGMQGCDVAFHLAAKVEEWGRYDDFYEVNVRGTEAVLEACRRAGVKRLVHVSTESVLLGGRPLVNADETWAPPRKVSGLYGRTKAIAEERVRAANGPTLETVVVRPRFIWGAGDGVMLPRFIEAVREGRFAWFGGGDNLTSTCHVQNAVEGLVLAAEKGRAGEIYFLTDGAPLPFRTFITQMLATKGVDPGDRSIPRPLASAGTWLLDAVWWALRLRTPPPLSHVAYKLVGEEVTVSDAKARRELGYVAAVTREEGLEEMRRERGAAP